MARETKGAKKLPLEDAGTEPSWIRAGYLSLMAFIDNARKKKTPLNNADSARISTLAAMMGRKSIYEHRVVTWEEVDV